MKKLILIGFLSLLLAATAACGKDSPPPPDPDVTLSAEEREIGGLGIFIAKKTMDSLSYSYEKGENVLTMIKKI